jgi:hypothetical protein
MLVIMSLYIWAVRDETYDLVRREVLYSILIDIGVTTKQLGCLKCV